MRIILNVKPSVRKNREKKERSLAIILSFVFHSLLFLLVGGIVIIKGPMQRQFFSSNEPMVGGATEAEDTMGLIEEDPMPEPEEASLSVTDAVQEMAPTVEFHASTITTTAAPQYTVFAPNVSGIAIGRTMGTAFGKSHGTGGGSGSGKAQQYIFNQKVEATQFGVLVDISGSMSPFTSTVVGEVLNKFPTANFFFLIGCGITEAGPAESEAIQAMVTELTPANWDSLLGPAGGPFRQLAERKGNYTLNGKFSKMMKLMAVPIAMETLAKEKVDTIYWFADFYDQIDLRAIRDIGRKLRRKEITLYLHHPGGLPSNFAKINYKADQAAVASDNMKVLNKGFFEQCKLKGGFIEQPLLKGKAEK